jgi:dephospho-CoA kinase
MKYLEELGYKTIYTDKIANEVMRSQEFLRVTSTYLKRNITIEDIKTEIENNNEFLDFLEHFVHPEVQRIRGEMIDKLLKINNIVFVEIPLFFEKQLKDVVSKHCKVFIVSTICGMEKQVLRAKKRNKNLSDKMLNIILSRQTSDANRVAGSDFIIYTYGRKKVKKEVQKLLRLLEDKNE